MNALSEIILRQASMSPIEKKIADYILSYPESVIRMTIKKMSVQVGVSGSSIINFSKDLGLTGFSDLKINIAQNLSSTRNILVKEENKSSSNINLVLDEYISAMQKIKKIIDPKIIDKIADIIISEDNYISLFGFGNTAPTVLDAQYWLSRIGIKSIAHIDPVESYLSASLILPGSVAIGFSQSGKSIHIVNAMSLAKKNGARNIAITQNYKSPLSKVCEVVLTTISQKSNIIEQPMSTARILMQIIIEIICISIENKIPAETKSNIEAYNEITREFLF